MVTIRQDINQLNPYSPGPSETLPNRSRSKFFLLVFLIACICLGVFAVHRPALSSKVLSFDDYQYLTTNVVVQNPGWSSAGKFLSEVLAPSTVAGYYQPLTMISLMIDYALGGRNDNLVPFRRTSIALHIANTALIIILLYMLFGRVWIAAAAGVLFGLHPMTVETMPWVGERKTLLAAFFSIWTLILYVAYVRKKDGRFYLAALFTFILALMSKPTSTPLPVLMLFMDFWPLKRLSRRCVLEKISFFVLAGISAYITYESQKRTCIAQLPTEQDFWRTPLIICHDIVFYLYKIVWPVNLSSHYAFPRPFGLAQPMVLVGVIGTLILIPCLIISLRWTRAFMAGWLFFFAGLLPTMQIVGFSNVIASDKFAYLPSIGLLMIWAAVLGKLAGRGAFKDHKLRRPALALAVLMLAGAEAVGTRRYLKHWVDTESHYRHMLKLTPDSYSLHHNMGLEMSAQGRYEEALNHYYQVLRLNPTDLSIHCYIGNALAAQGKFEEALSHYQKAMEFDPRDINVINNLGVFYARQGEMDKALEYFARALEVHPADIDANLNYANALIHKGQIDGAMEYYHKVLDLQPNNSQAHYILARLLLAQGKIDEAIGAYRRVLKIDPQHSRARDDLRQALDQKTPTGPP